MLVSPDLNNGHIKIILKHKVKIIFTVFMNPNFSDNLYISLKKHTHNSSLMSIGPCIILIPEE